MKSSMPMSGIPNKNVSTTSGGNSFLEAIFLAATSAFAFASVNQHVSNQFNKYIQNDLRSPISAAYSLFRRRLTNKKQSLNTSDSYKIFAIRS